MSYSITPSSVTVSEGVGSIVFTVARTATSISETVFFSTLQNLGFTNNNDYLGHLNTQLLFAAGVSTRTVTVNITNDSIIEGNESFSVLLDTLSGTVLDSSTFTITNDDSITPSIFTMTPATTSVSEAAGSVTFTITRNTSAVSETVFFSTVQNQGSTNSGDYSGIADQSVTFAAGQTTKTVTVSIINDSVVETNETFGAIIENATGATLDSSTFTITNDDSITPSIFTMTPATTSVSEAAGSVTFTITRNTSAVSETVFFSTVQNQGSTNSGDYSGIADQSVTFAAGQTTKTVTVNIINDSVVETNETFGAIIENATGATLDSSTFTITNDDVVSSPEVTVLGNSVSIADGDTTPNTADDTDFGSVAVGGAGVTRTFTVRNDGIGTLTLSNLTLPTGFTLVNGLVSSLAAGEIDTFQVRMDAATSGTKTGQISFSSNDSNESPFNFSIAGTVTPTPPTVWTKPVALANPLAGVLQVTQGIGGDTSHNSGYKIDLSTGGANVNVLSMGDGNVVSFRTGSTAGDDTGNAIGNFVTIQYAGGVYVTYAHLKSVSVTSGSVTAGQVIGISGNTGSDGLNSGNVIPVHLHIQFGTGLGTTTLGQQFATGGAVPPAFIASFVTANQTPGFSNVLNSIQKNDVFGTSDATDAAAPLKINADEDELDGTALANRIFGLSGNDRLYGFAGADTLVGGTGNDRLRGDANGGAVHADSFVFAPGQGKDRIVDFQDGVDFIRIVGFSGGFGALILETTSTATRVHYGADWIDLIGVNASLIGSADFVFV